MNAILQRDSRTTDDVASTTHDADAFLQFFEDKVRSVRAATASQPAPTFSSPADTQLLTFQPCSEDEVRRLITASPKSCALDPIPTFLLKEMINVLLPDVTAMINASLHEGRFPSSQKRGRHTIAEEASTRHRRAEELSACLQLVVRFEADRTGRVQSTRRLPQ